MNFAPLERIADAVLYEGYILYPYRPSALKNRQRWNFGTLYPRAFAERQSPRETCSFRAEVLIAGTANSQVSACVRFLQLLPAVGDTSEAWSQGVSRSATVEQVRLQEMLGEVSRDLAFAPSADELPAGTDLTGVPSLAGRLTLRAESLREGLWQLRAIFSNETQLPDAERPTPGTAQTRAHVSAHLLLGIEEGAFVSLLDPGPEFQAAATACSNQGIFPVLAGEAGDRSRMLCSPIILYDYPQIAPESSGDFFDGTEMDEMLALRVLTLTDEEKEEMRISDPHAANILARTEALPGEHMLKLHGAVRGMRPVSPAQQPEEVDGRIEPWNPFDESPPLELVHVSGIDVRCGNRVRLWPGKKADILDMAMNGKVAIIEAIEQDLEGNVQFAVVLEDDPGKDMGLLRQAGHRFFFTPEEIEPLRIEVS